MADYKWKPIEDLPDDWTKLASSELGGLAAVWVEHYETIKDSKALKQFNERLRREWAIETGIIENLYYIDRGVTLTLIEKGIEASLIPHGTTDRPAELIVPILKDHEEVVTGLFDFVGQQRQLSTSYIKQLHQALTQHQRTTAAKDNFGTMIEVELLRGDWKKLPNNPTKSDDGVHEYCPPEQVASEMDRLISLHQEHLEKGVPPEVEAAWLHHRFTQIHPFQDGNGRMARTLASLIFLRAGLFPFVVHRDERDKYLDVLLKADFGNSMPLVYFFSRAQKKAINQVLSLSDNILFETDPLYEIIQAAAKRLGDKKRVRTSLIQTQEKLEKVSSAKLQELAETLSKQLKTVDKRYIATKYKIDATPAINQKVKLVGNKLGYFADTSSYSSFVALFIIAGRATHLTISFHALGKKFSDIMAVSAFEVEVDKDIDISEPFPICKELFQFTNKEPEQAIIERYHRWLDETLLIGMNHWRQQL